MQKLKCLWDELARRHREIPGQPPPSGFQLFNRIADDLTRMLAEKPRPASGNYQVEGSIVQPSHCGECRTSGLQHFFTSWRTGERLCEKCFQGRMAGSDDRLKKQGRTGGTTGGSDDGASLGAH